jgi:hypothetical protein
MARGQTRVEGLAELDKALADLGSRLGAATAYRALEKVGAPIRDDIIAKVPVDDGVTKDSIKMIRASAERSRLGKAAFSQSLRDGGSVGAARGALRATIRGLKATASFAEVIIGPGRAPQAFWAEFGTGERFHANGKSVGAMKAANGGDGYMRPAWDAHSGGLAAKVAAELRMEVEKSASRVAARKARLAAKAR